LVNFVFFIFCTVNFTALTSCCGVQKLLLEWFFVAVQIYQILKSFLWCCYREFYCNICSDIVSFRGM